MPSWTNPMTWGAHKLLSVDLNAHVRDNLNYLKDNIAVGEPVELEIVGGVVTKTKTYHTIDTQGEIGTDDLETIDGDPIEGDIIIIRAEDAARTVVIKSTGNIAIGSDIALDDTDKLLMLIYDGSKWRQPFLLTIGTAAINPEAGHRGQLYFTEGGAGVADKLYCIMKSDGDTYSAIQIAIG